MNYQQYKEAAIRHLQTCNFMLRHIDAKLNKKETDRVLSNIYYLAGYIIECILCYSVFYLIKFDSKKSVYELDNDNGCCLRFQKHFRTHKFDKKIDFVLQNGGVIPATLPFIGKKQVSTQLKEMFEKWSPQIRYSVQNLTFTINQKNVTQFLKVTEEVYNGLRRI